MNLLHWIFGIEEPRPEADAVQRDRSRTKEAYEAEFSRVKRSVEEHAAKIAEHERIKQEALDLMAEIEKEYAEWPGGAAGERERAVVEDRVKAALVEVDIRLKALPDPEDLFRPVSESHRIKDDRLRGAASQLSMALNRMKRLKRGLPLEWPAGVAAGPEEAALHDPLSEPSVWSCPPSRAVAAGIVAGAAGGVSALSTMHPCLAALLCLSGVYGGMASVVCRKQVGEHTRGGEPRCASVKAAALSTFCFWSSEPPIRSISELECTSSATVGATVSSSRESETISLLNGHAKVGVGKLPVRSYGAM